MYCVVTGPSGLSQCRQLLYVVMLFLYGDVSICVQVPLLTQLHVVSGSIDVVNLYWPNCVGVILDG